MEQLGPNLPGMKCVKFLGAGGFADVFLYERDVPRIKVAVKIMKPGALTEAQRRQFSTEADTMALLAEHPFIVPVLGAGESGDGRPYLVMTYYPSSDLAARVARTPMSVAEALRYGIQLASAVETAHRSGVIHRDIKPSNILMSSYGVMGLSDFGIAGRPTDIGHEDEVGISLPWSPREVVVGESNGSVLSDVYSLAATVWHLMVGRAPFYIPGGDNSERATFTRIVHEKPQPLTRPDAPPSLERVLQQAMSKDPTYRPQTALALAQHFQRIEQEMRLARTEIVVLDHGGFTDTPPAQDAPGSESTSLWDRSGPGITTPGLTAPGLTTPGITGPSPTKPDHTIDPNATELKPPPRVVAQDPLRPAAGADASGATFATHPTDLRPVRIDAAAPGVDTDVVDLDQPSGGRRWKLVASAGLLLVIAVGAGFVLTNHGGSSKDQDLPSAPANPQVGGGGTIVLLAAPSKPTAIASSAATVTFRWGAVKGATGYGWQRDGDPARQLSTRTSYAVPRAASGQTCITVAALSSSGAYGAVSPRACG